MMMMMSSISIALCCFGLISHAFRFYVTDRSFVSHSSAALYAIPGSDSTGISSPGELLRTPESISSMMREVASSVVCAKSDGLGLVRVDIPLPVTGGTELDDWPGGIKQKYTTLRPMLMEALRYLNFSTNSIQERRYLNDYEDDGVGIWSDRGYTIISFATPDTIPYIDRMSQWSDNSSIIVLVNNQIFLDPLSRDKSKAFLSSLQVCYRLQNLNMRGPGALPVRGLEYRNYPDPFKFGRRLDKGGYEVICSSDHALSQVEVEKLFFEDSKVRDRALSFLDRLKKQVPNFGQ